MAQINAHQFRSAFCSSLLKFALICVLLIRPNCAQLFNVVLPPKVIATRPVYVPYVTSQYPGDLCYNVQGSKTFCQYIDSDSGTIKLDLSTYRYQALSDWKLALKMRYMNESYSFGLEVADDFEQLYVDISQQAHNFGDTVTVRYTCVNAALEFCSLAGWSVLVVNPRGVVMSDCQETAVLVEQHVALCRLRPPAIEGRWSVRASRADGYRMQRPDWSFTLGLLNLPDFRVLVAPSTDHLLTPYDSLTVNISAVYFYGRAVVNASVLFQAGLVQSTRILGFAQQLLFTDADGFCQWTLDGSIVRAALASMGFQFQRQTVHIGALVTTQSGSTASEHITIVTGAYPRTNFRFDALHLPATFTPGLPYQGAVYCRMTVFTEWSAASKLCLNATFLTRNNQLETLYDRFELDSEPIADNSLYLLSFRLDTKSTHTKGFLDLFQCSRAGKKVLSRELQKAGYSYQPNIYVHKFHSTIPAHSTVQFSVEVQSLPLNVGMRSWLITSGHQMEELGWERAPSRRETLVVPLTATMMPQFWLLVAMVDSDGTPIVAMSTGHVVRHVCSPTALTAPQTSASGNRAFYVQTAEPGMLFYRVADQQYLARFAQFSSVAQQLLDDVYASKSFDVVGNNIVASPTTSAIARKRRKRSSTSTPSLSSTSSGHQDVSFNVVCARLGVSASLAFNDSAGSQRLFCEDQLTQLLFDADDNCSQLFLSQCDQRFDKLAFSSFQWQVATDYDTLSIVHRSEFPNAIYFQRLPIPIRTTRYVPEFGVAALKPLDGGANVAASRFIAHAFFQSISQTDYEIDGFVLNAVDSYRFVCLLQPAVARTLLDGSYLHFDSAPSLWLGEQARVAGWFRPPNAGNLRRRSPQSPGFHILPLPSPFLCVRKNDLVVYDQTDDGQIRFEFSFVPMKSGAFELSVVAYRIDPFSDDLGDPTAAHQKTILVLDSTEVEQHESFLIDSFSSVSVPVPPPDQAPLLWLRTSIDLYGYEHFPTFANHIDQLLLNLPRHCGEQAMLSLAPQIYALSYQLNVHATNLPDAGVMATSIKRIKDSIDFMQQYTMADGGFSVWHQNYESSTWLTAFVARVFCEAMRIEDVLKRLRLDYSLTSTVAQRQVCAAMRFLRRQQLADGSFLPRQRVFEQRLVGGHSDNVTLAATVMISFLECRSVQQRFCNESFSSQQSSVDLAGRYLRQFVQESLDTEASLILPMHFAITTYALSRWQRAEALQANNYLLELSKTTNTGRRYWPALIINDKRLEQLSLVRLKIPYLNRERPLAIQIEAAGYALMAQLELGLMEHASSIAEWLVEQKSSRGFISTQDTVVGLEALERFAVRTRTASRHAEISVQLGADASNTTTFSFQLRSPNVLEYKFYIQQQHNNRTTFGNDWSPLVNSFNGSVSMVTITARQARVSLEVTRAVRRPISEQSGCRHMVMTVAAQVANGGAGVERGGRSSKQAAIDRWVRAEKDRLAGNASDVFRSRWAPSSGRSKRNASRARSLTLDDLLKQIVGFTPPTVQSYDGNHDETAPLLVHMQICVRLDNTSSINSTNMIVIEVAIPSGFEAVNLSLSDLMRKVAYHNVQTAKLVLYLDRLNAVADCYHFKLIRKYFVQSATPMLVTAYDYYEPGLVACSKFYSLPSMATLSSVCTDRHSSGADQCECLENCHKCLTDQFRLSLQASRLLCSNRSTTSNAKLASALSRFHVGELKVSLPGGVRLQEHSFTAHMFHMKLEGLNGTVRGVQPFQLLLLQPPTCYCPELTTSVDYALFYGSVTPLPLSQLPDASGFYDKFNADKDSFLFLNDRILIVPWAWLEDTRMRQCLAAK